MCGIKRLINTFENTTVFEDAIPIAGQYILHDGTGLDPQVTRLKTSPSASDREKEGFRLQLNGKKHPDNKKLVKQKAVIEFLCQDKAEEREERNLLDVRREEKNAKAKEDDDDDGGEKEDYPATGEVADDGHGGTLRYIDYAVVDDTKVLSLEWRTKYACENSKDNPSNEKKNGSGHWGFFTWLIIM